MSHDDGRQPCCDYCGLPVLARRWGGAEPVDEPLYCCFGCRFAAAVTQDRGEAGAQRATLTRLGIAVFFAMNVMVFTMALWSQEMTSGPTAALEATLFDVFRWAALVFSIPVLVLLGFPMLQNGWQDLRCGVPSTDALLIVGILAAYVYSVASVLREQGHVYFEVATMVLVLVTLGRWLEASGRLQATRALDELEKLLPATVRLIECEKVCPVALQSVAPGNRLRILPGERVPVDAELLTHATEVDEQILTGESRPVHKQLGDPLWAGTFNLTTAIDVRVTEFPGNGSFAKLIQQVRQARQMKGRYQRLADRTAAWFLPTVVAIALGAGSWHAYYESLDRGVLTGLSVLLIACPCALGLATPLAVWMALGRAAQHQVLFRNPEALERLATIRAIRFDKTGTLTSGAACVVDFISTESDTALRLAAQLAAASTHPYSRAIGRFATSAGLESAVRADELAEITQHPGRGLAGVLPATGQRVYLGSESYLRDVDLEHAGLRLGQDLQHDSLVGVGWGGRVRGWFVLREQPRPNAGIAVSLCRNAGLDVAVLSGDRKSCLGEIAERLALRGFGELRPEDKVAHIQAAQAQVGPVAMVGDGINDAPALAAADVGIALGCGADVSRESADVCLQANDLTRVVWALELSRQAVRTIRQNLAWAFGYNGVGVVLAAGGLLNPILAAVLMLGSSLFVVTNSLRLSRFEADEPVRIPSDPEGTPTAVSEPFTNEHTGVRHPLQLTASE